MAQLNVWVGTVTSLSFETKALSPKQASKAISVTLAEGQAFQLDAADEQQRIWGRILESMRKLERPVYVRLDPATSAVEELLLPIASTVREVRERKQGDGVDVDLVYSAGCHVLRCSHPSYKDFLKLLQDAVKSGGTLLVTDTSDCSGIIDVRPGSLPRAHQKKTEAGFGEGAGAAELAPITPARAAQLFDLVSAVTCNPGDPLSPCIPFLYPNDGCWARANEMCRLMAEGGEESQKVWIYRGASAPLRVDSSNNPSCQVQWKWHVAPVLSVLVGGSVETWVIDPSLFSTPVPLDVWSFAQHSPDATTTITDRSLYMKFGGPTSDPDYSITQQDLQYHRDRLLALFSTTGGPPYPVCYKPDLFLRDNLMDEGLEPLVGGGISCSPDINHFRNELADPQATLCGASAKQRDDLFEPAEYGQTNYIYVRLQNRGAIAADATIDLYYSLASSLPTPSSWHLIGTIATASPIAPGEFKAVGPLLWDTVPQVGHYCFIASVDTPKDPKPDLSQVHTIQDFYSLIRQRNNVTWKNFDVDNFFADSEASFSFLIRGWPRKAYLGDLELDTSQMPADSKVELRILKRLATGAVVTNLKQVRQTSDHVVYQVIAKGQSIIQNMHFYPSDQSAAVVSITTQEGTPDGAYQFAAIQRIGGNEVGRITRRLNIGKYPYVGNRSTLELHEAKCDWARKVSARHKVAFENTERPIWLGYNGCRYCLPDLDTDR